MLLRVLLLLILFAPSALGQAYGMWAVQVWGTAKPVPVYSLKFNTDAGPFGVGQSGASNTIEDGSGDTADCLTHDATATNAVFNCQYTAGSPPEGDGVARWDGTITQQTDWTGVHAELTDFWVKVWFYIDEAVGQFPVNELISWRKADGAMIGTTGYIVRLRSAASNDFQLVCDAAGETVSSAYADTPGWLEYMFHVNLTDGDIDMWITDLTGPPDHSCDGLGGDQGTPVVGHRFGAQVTLIDELRWDDYRVFNADPR